MSETKRETISEPSKDDYAIHYCMCCEEKTSFRWLQDEDKVWKEGEEPIYICTKCGEEFVNINLDRSVNCFACGKLVDERETVENFNGEGELCQACVVIARAANDLLKSCEAILRVPSIGSHGPGSITLEVQSFVLDDIKNAVSKAKGFRDPDDPACIW